MSSDKRARARDLLILPLAFVICLGWLATLAQAMLEKEYTALTVVSPLMLLLAGFAFGTSIVKSVTKANDEST